MLRPGDVVRVRIWREPDLSGDFKVDEAGEVILPRLGPTDVEHLSRDSLKLYLISSYKAYLRNPTIEVMLLRQVKVVGAVRNPGAYPVDAMARVADVIAAAGGATPDGRPDQVELVRPSEGGKIKLNGDMLLVDTPIRSGDQLIVPQRSWLSRNAGFVVGTITGIAGLAIAISRP